MFTGEEEDWRNFMELEKKICIFGFKKTLHKKRLVLPFCCIIVCGVKRYSEKLQLLREVA